jgi:hypothetical protein
VKTNLSGTVQRVLNPESVPVFMLALVCITSIHWHFKQAADTAAKRFSAQYRSFAGDLERAGGSGSSLLYLSDPFALDRFDPEFIATLVRGKRTLRIGRARANQALLSPAVAAMYDDIFDFENGHLHRIAKSDLSPVLDRLRAQSGSFDPLSGLHLTTDGSWRTNKEFVVTARCPAVRDRCEVVFDLGAIEGAWRVSVDVDGAHRGDLSLSAASSPSRVPVSLTGSERSTPVRFVIDRAVPAPELDGQGRALPFILSGVHVY